MKSLLDIAPIKCGMGRGVQICSFPSCYGPTVARKTIGKKDKYALVQISITPSGDVNRSILRVRLTRYTTAATYVMSTCTFQTSLPAIILSAFQRSLTVSDLKYYCLRFCGGVGQRNRQHYTIRV